MLLWLKCLFTASNWLVGAHEMAFVLIQAETE
jgi:hypothetical protein